MASANTSAGAQGPPPQLSPESAPLFSEGISLVLSQWSALQMAIENEWGGRGSRALAEQLGSDIFSWFTQSKGKFKIVWFLALREFVIEIW